MPNSFARLPLLPSSSAARVDQIRQLEQCHDEGHDYRQQPDHRRFSTCGRRPCSPFMLPPVIGVIYRAL